MITTNTRNFANIVRKIKCPRHYLLRPGFDPFLTEINPMYKKLPKWAFKRWNIPIERIKRDSNGEKMVNWRNYYQPEISAAHAIDAIYDPENPVCIKCQRRCFDGQGKVNTRTIKRLNTR